MSASPPLLIVARLTVRSTYADNWESPAGDDFDTVQFYIPGDGAAPIFRVRTFAVDHDIHVHQIGGMPDAEQTLLAHLARTYGDVATSVHSVVLHRRSSEDLVATDLTTGHLEWAPEEAFAFWNPDGAPYRTQSRPEGA